MADEPSSSSESENKDAQPEFKMPVLIGRIGKLPKKAPNLSEKALVEKHEEKLRDKPTDSGSKSSLPPALLYKELSTPIPYKEPKWSGLCPDGSDYALEVVKSGCIVERIDLTTKPYYVFGRLANCDVLLAHPTISRHHCVLQYKAFAEEGEQNSGWYMYDLCSTHGTFLNKERLKPSHYARVKVGHQIKYGNSTRTYILLGPDFDCEGESELSVTEIKQRAEVMRVERDRMIQEAKEQRERDRIEEEKRRADQGIDWGMGEDAEDEPDLTENPFAVPANEELYLEDPKKTLRGFFEREGHELKYDCEERGQGQYMCKVALPMDDARGRPVVAEVHHSGRKKEAVVACALEACRVLDRAGLLRQAKHESRRRKPRDSSDSDDDNYLDRTGHVERRRAARMRRRGDSRSGQPLTYDNAMIRIEELEKKIASSQTALDKLRARASPSGGASDELDAYMNSLHDAGQTMAVKAEISQAKMGIQQLKAELSKTHRLADIARAPLLPPLIKKSSQIPVKINKSVIYGKRMKLKDDAERRAKPKPVADKNREPEEFVEEVDSDEELPQTSTSQDSTPQCVQEISESTESELETDNSEKKETSETQDKDEGFNVVKKVYGPMRPPDNYVIPEDYFNQESGRDLPEIMEKE